MIAGTFKKHQFFFSLLKWRCISFQQSLAYSLQPLWVNDFFLWAWNVTWHISVDWYLHHGWGWSERLCWLVGMFGGFFLNLGNWKLKTLTLKSFLSKHFKIPWYILMIKYLCLINICLEGQWLFGNIVEFIDWCLQ